MALPFLLASSVPVAQPAARELVTASVQIVAAEEIRFVDLTTVETRGARSKVTQKRVRGAMPMIEYY